MRGVRLEAVSLVVNCAARKSNRQPNHWHRVCIRQIREELAMLRKYALIATLAVGSSLLGTGYAAEHRVTPAQHRAHKKTAKRVGVGAAGGAAIGALAGGGKGAAIGALAGGGGGYLYDKHKKKQGR